MASLSLSQFLLPPRSPRWSSELLFSGSVCIAQIPYQRVPTRWKLTSLSKRRLMAAAVAREDSIEGDNGKRKTRGRKKGVKENEEDESEELGEGNSKPKRKTKSKVTSSSIEEKEEKCEKKKRGRKKKVDNIDDQGAIANVGEIEEKSEKKPRGRKPKKNVNKIDQEVSVIVGEIDGVDEDSIESKTEKKPRGRKPKKKEDVVNVEASDIDPSDFEASFYVADEDFEDETVLDLEKNEDDDVSITYTWPPLVCCFGAAQHLFVPSGRPANRLIDYEIHGRMKDALWEPEKFVRAPGGCAGSVAIALASLGGKVAFMGKLGDDDFGHSMVDYMKHNGVQTRAVCIDSRRASCVTKMRISKRGNLRTTLLKPCAEDSLTKSEINVDVLKEAKMFYLSSSSLLDQNMRKTTIRALNIAKKLGSVIFFDVNLPMPLWQSHEEARGFVLQVWCLADVIEVTKQELEFLCGIRPSESFDTRDNHASKFRHYEPDVIAPLWHENLKILFVTNGTSKIHYYTKEHDGFVHGMEDPPVTPSTSDMSAAGDGIVAAIMRMLSVQPHLITDKGYIEQTVKYAINCGVIDQWILGKQLGYPPFEGMGSEAVPNEYGLISLTEREFRSVKRAS